MTMPKMTVPRSIRQPRATVRTLAEGFGALVVLVCGLVGIPLVLATTVGWPLPHHLGGGGQVADALRSTIPDSFWPHLFASLAWIAWAYFVFSVLTSAISRVRTPSGHRRRPLGRHSAAAGLVSTVITAAVLLSQLRGAPSGRIPAPPSVATAPFHSAGAASPPATLSVVGPSLQLVSDSTPLPAAQTAKVTHTVVAGDTLWGIAQTYYGNGEQWEAIYQANVGVPQPDGRALSDAHWIYPGWTLVIPNLTATAPAPSPSPAAAPVVPPPASVAAPTTQPAATQSTATQPAHALTSHDDHDATTSQGVTTPHAAKVAESAPHHAADTVPPPAASGAPSTRHPGAAPRRPHDVHKPTATHHVRSGGDEIGPLAIGAGIFGLAAIGIVAALDRRRRRQRMRRAPGRRIPLPAPRSAAADLELALRQYARADGALWLTRLGDLLAYAADRDQVPRPRVLGVEANPQGLDVFVAGESGEAPAPFEPGAQPDVWHLPLRTDPGVLDEAVVAEPVRMTLLSIGQRAGVIVLINLEHYLTVHVQVPAERAPGTLAAIGTELAAASGSRARVLAVGFGHGVIDRFDDGVVAEDLHAALRQLQVGEETIVLVDGAMGFDGLTELGQRADVRLVTAGPVAPVGTGLVVDPTQPTPTGLPVQPVDPIHVTEELLIDLGGLLDLAEAPANAEPADEPYASIEDALVPATPQPDDAITLGLLGEPGITVGQGSARDLLEAVSPTAGTKARRVVELLVYLAAHGGSATRGQWLTDVSPDKTLSDGYVRNLVLLTRRSLEALTGDDELLAYERASQRFTLADRIRSDWTMFRSSAADGEPAGLRTALSLVRSMPFGANPEPWTSAGGLSYAMVAEIVDAATSLAEHALSISDSGLAVWAARQGQLVDRYDQGLWRLLLRAAGDVQTRERIWRELHDLLAIDGEPAEDLDPETVDLYNRLCAPRAVSADVIVLQGEDEMVIPTRQAV
jgi:LysM domain